MWTVVYISRDCALANEIMQLLEQAGILSKLKTVDAEDSGCSYEILVPDTEVEEAHNLILDKE